VNKPKTLDLSAGWSLQEPGRKGMTRRDKFIVIVCHVRKKRPGIKWKDHPAEKKCHDSAVFGLTRMVGYANGYSYLFWARMNSDYKTINDTAREMVDSSAALAFVLR
jgi:hypothetical protein